MSTQTSEQGRDDGGGWVLDPRPFILHNAHVKDGRGPQKGCGLCPGIVEKDVGLVAIPVRDSGILQSDRVDEKGSTASAPSSTPWGDFIAGGVQA